MIGAFCLQFPCAFDLGLVQVVGGFEEVFTCRMFVLEIQSKQIVKDSLKFG